MSSRRNRSFRRISRLAEVERFALWSALDDWRLRLADMNESVPLLVEGIHDEQALRKLGIEGDIQHLHMHGMSIYDLCKLLESRYEQVLVLLDWDPRGRALRRRVLRYLEIDWETYDPLRAELEQLVGAFLSHIEDLHRFYETLYIMTHFNPV